MTDPAPKPVLTPISRWLVYLGVPLMVLVAAGTIWLLLGTHADSDTLDAIRTGGTIGVGLGGVVALWLAIRKQRTTELDVLQKYAAAQDTRDDATERRITELYTKAVEQLGGVAPVRLGGLYALERLAQDNVSQRQTIVNVICAYLRMPFTPVPRPEPVTGVARASSVRPGPPSVEREDPRYQEQEVRRDPDRLRPDLLQPAWFTGTVAFDQTRFLARALFNGARFDRAAIFPNADLGAAWFASVAFFDQASFVNATFHGRRQDSFRGEHRMAGAIARDGEHLSEWPEHWQPGQPVSLKEFPGEWRELTYTPPENVTGSS